MQAEYGRQEIGALIAARLEQMQRLAQPSGSGSTVTHFVVDDLLPVDLATRIFESFPGPRTMMLRKSLRERKYVTSQMDRCERLMEEIVYAFQEPAVVAAIGEITGLRELEADPNLYAGGLSLMPVGAFLNPHIDNSHDKERRRYRALNLLYYVTPGWGAGSGGHLELWPNGAGADPLTIESVFNRLVVMATGTTSWHSVSPVRCGIRRCVSNYYFSAHSPESADYFHVTSFRGRPDQKIRTILLKADAALRMAARRIAPGGIVKTKHYYRR